VIATQKRDYAALLRGVGVKQKSRKGTLERILAILEKEPRGSRVLDVPSGPGLLSGALAELGFDVQAADLNSGDFALHGRVPFQPVDLDAALPFKAGSFDVVVCSDGIEHLENQFATFREFARLLRPGGSIVIATPNYLNIERRLKFLVTGSLCTPVERRPDFLSGPKVERGHINPLTLTRMAYMAESAGLELVDAGTALGKPKQVFLFPVAAVVAAWSALLRKEQRERLFADRTQSLGMLMGGKKLIAVFRKRS